MDPLSTTASIIAIIQLSSEVIGFIGSATGASKTRRRLLHEIQACDKIVQDIKDEADESEEGKAWSEKIKALEQPDAPLGRLSITLRIVKTKLDRKDGEKKALAAFRWPFEEKEVGKIIDAIEREKNLLQLALENNQRQLVQCIQRSAKDHSKKLIELIDAVRKGSIESQDRLAELRHDITRVAGLEVDLKDGIDRLHLHNDRQEATKAHQDILNWLTPVDYAAQQSDFIDRRQAGTGQWFLDSPEFRNWLQDDKQTLFCPGIPGAGKTILTSIVIDELTTCFGNDESIGIAYVYCNFRQKQKADDILASLLKQLAQSQPSLSERVRSMYDKHNERRTRPSSDEILNALQTVAGMHSKTFIIIDALDECQASNGCRSKLLAGIFNLQAKCGVNIFATSRFIPEVTENFDPSTFLEIRARKGDIEMYLEENILKLSAYDDWNDQLRDEITTSISDMVDGMFLLAQIYLQFLDDKTTRRVVRNTLVQFRKQIPGSTEDQKRKVLDQAYEDAMKRINEQGPSFQQLAKKVLSWITCAEKPLTTLELQHALAVEVGDSNIDEDNFEKVERMVSVCVGLVTVDEESSIIRLVHYTTQEYFERTLKDWFPDAQSQIATICTAYLSFDVFSSGLSPTDDHFEQRLRLNPFLNYAARNWGHHARKAMALQQQVIDFLQSRNSVEASTQVLTASKQWSRHFNYSQEVPKQMTALHLSAYFGIEKAVNAFLQRGVEADSKDSYGQTPLSWAAGNGHEAAVKLLLNTGKVDADSKDRYGCTPLCCAARNGHEAIIKLLLNTGKVNADLKDRDDRGCRTPLSYAAENGHEAVVKLLLNTEGVNAGSKDRYGQTPLWYSVWDGHEAVVKLLLNAEKVEADLEDRLHGQTPLSLAAKNGHEAVVKLLLNTGKVEADSKDKFYGRTPLSYAAGNGHEAIFKLLLNTGKVDADSKDIYGRTPLWHTAGNGHEAIVKLLLNIGKVSSLDLKDNMYGQTPLSYAAGNGHEAIVKLLLNTGKVDADSKDKHDRTPLSYAAEKGHEAIFKLLLSTGKVDVDSKDKYGQTPLWHTAGHGHEAIVKLLLNTGKVDANLKDNLYGHTPLSYAAQTGHEAVVRILQA